MRGLACRSLARGSWISIPALGGSAIMHHKCRAGAIMAEHGVGAGAMLADLSCRVSVATALASLR